MIRPLKKSDKTEFIAMLRQFYNSDAVASPLPEKYYGEIFVALTRKNSTAKAFILCTDNGETVGYGVVNKTFSMEAAGDTLWIEDLFVREKFRGKGFGKEFITFILGKYEKVRRIRLEVEEQNVGAIKLYSTFGFKCLDYKQMIIDK